MDNSLFSYVMDDDGTLKIKLEGEIDHHSAVNVRSDIDDLIFCKRPRRVVLDLSKISFMDSSGLGLIMGRYSLSKEVGAQLVLHSPTVAVMRILTLAGMEKIIKIEGENKNEKK